MSSKEIQPYVAMPLQFRCDTVNSATSIPEARDRIMRSLDRCAKVIRSSIVFANTFFSSRTRLVVLPEYFLTGFPMGEDVATWQKKACLSINGEEYKQLGQIARDQNIYLAGNVYELDPNFETIYFQTSIVIDPNGEVVLRYRRLISMYSATPHDVLDAYLYHYGEDSLFPVVDTEIGVLGCIASEEILYPEISRALTLKGSEVLCHSTGEIGSTRPTVKNVAKQARAYENITYVVSANNAGLCGTDFPESSTDGHSQVVNYQGSVLAIANVGESMVGASEIDIMALRRTRSTPAMTNVLGRQRLEIFKDIYSKVVYPANNLLVDGQVISPNRAHFSKMQQDAIANLTCHKP